MPAPALLLLIATLLPLLSFTILVFVGKRMGPLAGIVGTLAIAGSFGCSIGAMMVWLQASGGAWAAGKLPIDLTFPWLPVGVGGVSKRYVGFIDVGIYVDSLTFTMLALISIVVSHV